MSDPLVQPRDELAPGGRLRVAINLGNPVLAERSASGELFGISVDLARELARRLQVELDLVPFDAAGKVFDALATAAWDLAFLAIDPVRAKEIAFTPPYVVIEGTYIVRDDSPLRRIEDFDAPGVRIAVGRGAAYDLYLTRALKHAELIRADTGRAALDQFVREGLEAAAGVKQPLLAFARERAGFRVIDGNFTEIRQAMGVPKSRSAAIPALHEFIEEMKRSGFVAAALARHRKNDAVVAPAQSAER